MKKRIKTTDSIIKDIFDPLLREEDKSDHPLSSFTGDASAENDAAANRIESLVTQEDELFFAGSRFLESQAEEIKTKSVLFNEQDDQLIEPPQEVKPAAVVISQAEETMPTEEVIDQTTSAIVTAQAGKSSPPLDSHRWIMGSVFLVFALLSLSLGSFLYLQHRQIRNQNLMKPLATAAQPHPALLRLNSIGHPGVSFSGYSVKNKKFLVKGTVTSQALLVQFLNSINSSPYFGNAIISSIAATGPKGRQNNYSFQIYADIRA